MASFVNLQGRASHWQKTSALVEFGFASCSGHTPIHRSDDSYQEIVVNPTDTDWRGCYTHLCGRTELWYNRASALKILKSIWRKRNAVRGKNPILLTSSFVHPDSALLGAPTSFNSNRIKTVPPCCALPSTTSSKVTQYWTMGQDFWHN